MKRRTENEIKTAPSGSNNGKEKIAQENNNNEKMRGEGKS